MKNINEVNKVNGNSTIKEIIQARKETFQPNYRVILLENMDDPFSPLQKGLKGTVRLVDDIGNVHVNWDNRSRLGVTLEDSISIVLYERFIEKYLEKDVFIRMSEMGYTDHNDIWSDVADHFEHCRICEYYVDKNKQSNGVCMQCESGYPVIL